MLRIELDGAAVVNTMVTRVSLTPLDSVVGPTEFVTGTANSPIKILDLSAAAGAEGPTLLWNNGTFTVYYCLGTPGTPGLTTANGIALPAGAFITLDTIGGLCLWMVTGTPQVAGSGVRVSAGYNA